MAIKVNEAAALHLNHSRIINQPILYNWMHVQDYCIKLLAYGPVQHFLSPCPDNQDRLIGKETMSIGTIDQTTIYLCKVVNTALKHHAQSVILVQNHPSGESKP